MAEHGSCGLLGTHTGVPMPPQAYSTYYKPMMYYKPTPLQLKVLV